MNEKEEKICNFQLDARFEEFTNVITSVLYYNPSTVVVSCSNDRDVYVLDLTSKKLIKTISNASEVKCLVKWNDEEFLCCVRDSKILSYRNPPQLKKGKIFDFSRSKPYIMIKLDNVNFASVTSKGDVLLTSYSSKKSKKVSDKRIYDVSSIVMSKLYPNSIYLTTSFRNKNAILLLHCEKSRIVKSFQQHKSTKVHSIETFITPSAEEILACSIYEKIVLYDSTSESVIFEIPTPRCSSYSLYMYQDRYLVCGEHMKKSNNLGIFDLQLDGNQNERTFTKILDVVISSERNWKVTNILQISESELSSSLMLCSAVGKVVQLVSINNLKNTEERKREDDGFGIRKIIESGERVDTIHFLNIHLKNKELDNICKVFLEM